MAARATRRTVPIPQRAFNRGIVGPSIEARSDLELFQSAVRDLVNMFVLVEGGAANRAGYEFIQKLKEPGAKMFPFEVNVNQAYLLEIGSNYMRVFLDGAPVRENAVTISATALGTEERVEVTATGCDYQDGDEVFISGPTLSPEEIRDRTFLVQRIDADSFYLVDPYTGATIDGAGWTVGATVGVVSRTYELALSDSWSLVELPDVDYDQSVDLMFFVHPSHPPRVLSRGATDTLWTLEDIDWRDRVQPPDFYMETSSYSGDDARKYRYAVSAVDENGVESIAPVLWNSGASGFFAFTEHSLGSTSGTPANNQVELAPIHSSPIALYLAASATTAANPIEVTYTPTFPGVGIEDGQLVWLHDFDGAFEVNGRFFYARKVDDTHFELFNDADLTEPEDGTGGVVATTGKVLQVSSFDRRTRLFRIYRSGGPEPYASEGDPWTFLQEVPLERFFVPPRRYRARSGVFTDDTPVEVQSVGFHGLANGQQVYIDLPGSSIDKRIKTVTFVDTQRFTLDGTTGTGLGGDTEGRFHRVEGTGSVQPYVDWGDVGPDVSQQPVEPAEKFDRPNEYPGSVHIFQQRLILGRTNNDPNYIWASQSAGLFAFDKSVFTKATSPIDIPLEGQHPNEVRHIIGAEDLIVLTEGAEWRVNSEHVLTYETARPRRHSSYGAAKIKPVLTEGAIAFVDRTKRKIREMLWAEQQARYVSREITVLVRHLFDGEEIRRTEWQDRPYPILWVLLESGKLYGVTKMREEQVLGWHRHTTDGLVRDICVSREVDEDYLYLSVERTINGSTHEYMERMHSRELQSIEEGFFVDAGLSLSVNTSAVVSITAITYAGTPVKEWRVEREAGFVPTDGDIIDIRSDTLNGQFKVSDTSGTSFTLNYPDDTLVSFPEQSIISITNASPGVVAHGFPADYGISDGDAVLIDGTGSALDGGTFYADVTAPGNFALYYDAGLAAPVDTTGLTFTSPGTWSKQVSWFDLGPYLDEDTGELVGGTIYETVTVVRGAEHLEGEQVKVLANGWVEEHVVQGGRVTLDYPASIVHLGLGYDCWLETLDVETDGSLQNRRVRIAKVWTRVEKSASFLAGPGHEDLAPVLTTPERPVLGAPYPLAAGKYETNVPAVWGSSGRLIFKGTDPVPLTILAITPEVEVGA